MRIAVISDQLSDDLEEAFQLGELLGVNAFELRWLRPPGSLRLRRVSELSDEDAEGLAAAAKRHGASVSAISAGLFRHRWDNRMEFAVHMQSLQRALHVARIFGAPHVIIHGFLLVGEHRNGVCPPGVVDALGQAAELAAADGAMLLIRNAPDCYTDSGAHTASIVHAVHSPALGVSWDPCHAVRAGEEDICAGYEWLLPFVRDVCIKDQERREGLGYEYTVMAEGTMDWPAQLRALIRDGFQGTATLGSQVEPRLLNTMHSLDALHKLLRQVRSANAISSL